jgi:hypothetical protein
MSRSTWLLLGIGAGGLLVLAAATSAKGQVNRGIALIGDSYAVGLGPILAKLLPDFRFEGHVGTNTREWATGEKRCGGQCGSWLAAFAPAIVLVSLGVNDGLGPRLADYQAIVQKIQALGARVVWIEPPADIARQAVRQDIASLGVTTIPATQTPLGPDGVHPVSYEPWARQIAQVVA